MTKKEFLIKIVQELLDDNFSILLHRKDNLDGYGGWFGAEDGEREFVVALNNSMGFETALHEYCHYLQWKHDREIWEKSALTYDILFEWIDKPESNYTDDQLKISLYDIIELEYDCEKRALNLLTDYNIEDIDRDQYIRAVNAYLFHYHINLELRKRPKSPIYSNDVLVSMPIHFGPSLDYYLNKDNITDSMKMVFLPKYEMAQEQI